MESILPNCYISITMGKNVRKQRETYSYFGASLAVLSGSFPPFFMDFLGKTIAWILIGFLFLAFLKACSTGAGVEGGLLDSMRDLVEEEGLDSVLTYALLAQGFLLVLTAVLSMLWNERVALRFYFIVGVVSFVFYDIVYDILIQGSSIIPAHLMPGFLLVLTAVLFMLWNERVALRFYFIVGVVAFVWVAILGLILF